MMKRLLLIASIGIAMSIVSCDGGGSGGSGDPGDDTTPMDAEGDAGLDTQPLPDAGEDAEPLADIPNIDSIQPGDTMEDEGGPDMGGDLDAVETVCEEDADCDDDDWCTTDSCIDGLCFNQGKDCDDQDKCTEDGCDPETGQCTYKAVDCDDGNDCTVESCKPATGCEYIDLEDCCEPDVVVEWDMEEDIEGLDIVNLEPEASPDVGWTFSGANVWDGATSLYFGDPAQQNFDSDARVRGSVTFPPALIPEGVEAELRFFAWLDVEETVFADVFTVYVVQVDGTRIPALAKTAQTTLGEWEEWVVHLNAYAGEAVRIEFFFDSFNAEANDGEGIYVDDLRIAGRCALPDPCIADVDCNDFNPCTDDACVDDACAYEITALCCMFQAQCDDDDPCTIDECTDGACDYVTTPNCCDEDADCEDDDVCTKGICTDSICFQVPSGALGCCEVDADCDDLDVCTDDICDEGSCVNTNLCCFTDEECDDGDDVCTVDSCVNGDCVYQPTGEEGCCLETMLDEDFGGSTTGWTFGPMNEGNVGWQVWDGGPDSDGDALYYGNILTQNFDNGLQNSGEVISPEIWLQPGTDNVLGFDLYMVTELLLAYDIMQIFVDWTGDGTWILVWDKSALVGMGTWSSYVVDLSGLAGETIRVRFWFDSDDETNNEGLGVLVDNILIGSTCLPKVCAEDLDCVDDVPGTIGTCADGLCQYEISQEPCQTAADCDDDDQCTIDTCEVAFCEHTPAEDCCYVLADCEDDNVCTTDACELETPQAPQCTHDWAADCCIEDENCVDGNPCTDDVCPGEGEQCTNPWIDGCCLSDPDCEDDDPCTLDDCSDNVCVNQYYCCDGEGDCDDGDDVCTNDDCVDGFCQFLPSGEAGCCEPLLFEEGFDGGLGAWTLEGGDDTYFWQASTTQFQSGISALYFGNTANDTYGNSQDATATSPEVELPLQPGLTLDFWLWHDTESGFDDLTVSVVTDDGAEVALAEFDGDSAGWTEQTFDLDAFAGESVYIRFTWHSDSSISDYPGAYVDSLTVSQSCCNEDTDCEDGNPCTTDTCPGAESLCINTWDLGCCLEHSDCDDEDPCTTDHCSGPGGTCSYIDICCDTDEDCDDGDDVCTDDACVNGFCQFLPSGEAGCCEPLLYEEGFDGGLGAWTLEGGDDIYYWQASTVQFQSGVSALYFGNAANNSYGNSQDATATSPEIELPLQPGLSLDFWIWHDIESGYDDLSVSVVTDDGGEVMLAEFDGDSAGWAEQTFDLDDFAGESIYIRFTFHSDGSISDYPGAYIDGLTVSQSCCNDDLDCDDDNPCTTDTCPGAESLCINTWDLGCCLNNADCDDDDPCTADDCSGPGGACSYINICCDTDEDCEDGDDVCTDDVCIDGTCQFLPSGAAGCCDPEIWTEGFEDGLDAWTLTDEDADEFTWKAIGAQTYAGSSALYFGNDLANSYGDGQDGYALSQEIELPQQPDLTLSFWLWYDTETNYDDCSVYLVHADGETLLQEFTGHDQMQWTQYTYDLDAWSGQTAQVKIVWHSDSSVSTYPGCFFDELLVAQDCCNEDVDCDDGDLCTTDSCPGPDSLCINLWQAGCCNVKADCDDGDPCTAEMCEDMVCGNPWICCEADEDCDDDDDVCTMDACVDSYCEYTQTGEEGCCDEKPLEALFDGDDGSWTFSDPSGDVGWNIWTTPPDWDSGVLYYGNPGAGNFDTPGAANQGTAISPEGLLSPAVGYDLSFDIYIDGESLTSFDKPTLYVSWMGPEGPWVEIWSKADYDTAAMATWQSFSLDLSGLAGKGVYFRWLFESGDSLSNTGLGAMVDNFIVSSPCAVLDCGDDADCVDDVPGTTGACEGGICGYVASDKVCETADDCDDADVCTVDACVFSICENDPAENCCYDDAGCEDDNPCTADACDLENLPAPVCENIWGEECCLTDDDCYDGVICTFDTCPGEGEQCTYSENQDCCLSDMDCDDVDECTIDICVDNVCANDDVCCSEDTDCDDVDPCTDDACTDGLCEYTATGADGCCIQPLFEDDFSTLTGWTLDQNWEIGPTMPGGEPLYGNPDPEWDHSSNGDNSVLGVVIGGWPASDVVAGPFWATSPVVDISAAVEPHISGWRWLNSDYAPFMIDYLQVWDGTMWEEIWTNPATLTAITDDSWVFIDEDVTEYKNAAFQVRIGYEIGNLGAYDYTQWNIDDVKVYDAAAIAGDDLLCCGYDSDCEGIYPAGAACTGGQCM